ncbi:hypothetical protein DAPPUDRAFT_302514 [Daphnia pulex]|uniref:Death domain-containing protein n=1 Tax=Daphnia pulex TaxID=6669 RepID=E9GDJ6_DAPPU|nr:hypothetical protein DAPPUDRAFT_302514 [Daphnia pulex]|eukprot:EFX82465.1 hypothetical protein DAPPUDRAFT_302514 [Daphnia pulex]
MADFSINPALDQELEDIRTRDVPGPPDVTKCLEDWLTKGANYSIKKLTSDNQIGWDILHIIARFVDGTPVGSHGDWKHLAGLLGLHIHDIIRIENFSTVKGATLEILSQFALKNHASLSKLLEALNIMERHDVLYAISEKLKALFNPTSTSNQVEDSTPSQLSETDSEMDSGLEFSITGEGDPENLKSVPLGSSLSPPLENKLQIDSNGSDKKKYKKTVLLTFTQDGYEIANQVARQIRSSNLGIGVLILEENRDELEFCGESIYRWYQEVDYIIPIITEEYLWQISPGSANTQEVAGQSEPTCLDARYARLIYVMMLEEYQRNHCLNYRVRPLESNLLVRRTHYLLRSPIFSFRKGVNQVDKLASILAQAKIRTNIH